jgi:restriction modification system DNA specificity domain protein
VSRINALIRDLCPDGVEYKSLGEVGRLLGGLTGKTKADFVDGTARYVSYKNVYSNLEVDVTADDFVRISNSETQNALQIGDILFTGSSENREEVGITSVITSLPPEPLYLNSFCICFRPTEIFTLLPEFAKHLFRSGAIRHQIIKTATGVTRINISRKNLAKIQVPLPPVEVQQEVARILDQLTQLEAELEAELKAELEARRQQFTYYRNLIVSGSQQAQLVPIKDIGKLQRGRRFTRNDMVGEGIPAIHYGEIYTTYGHKTDSTASFVKDEIEPQLRFAQPGDVIIAAVGETVADVGTGVAWLGTAPVAYHDDSFALHHNQDPRYVSHALRTSEYHRQKDRYVSRAKVKRLSARGIEQIRIPLPALGEQRRIADILDDFDALINDLTLGLPAEIEARRKQYEYYRDRLLTFPEKN